MTEPLLVKNILIGAGMPKIIVSITERTQAEALLKAERLSRLAIDAVEWRADCLAGRLDEALIENTLSALRKILPQTALLFTLRTAKEGGMARVGAGRYQALLQAAAATQNADMIDIEMLTPGDEPLECARAVHQAGGVVVGSSHDFERTPSKSEMVERFSLLEARGADILKIAVYPHTPADVLSLLSACEQMRNQTARPLIAISMSNLGVVSRMCGEIFGSAMSFASVGPASAPGQIPLEDLHSALSIIHNNQ